LAALLTALLLQATLVGPLAMSVPVSLPAVLVAAVALVDGPATGMSFGFTVGLFADLGSSHPAGVLALSGVKLLNVPGGSYVIAIGFGLGLTAFVVWLWTGMPGVQSPPDETQRTDDSGAPAHRGDRDGIRGDTAPEARA
jgi:hypothetical protein